MAGTGDVTARFAARFRGLERAHGRYTPRAPVAGQKTEGKALTVSDRLVSVELHAKHLEGTYGIGIVPITDDATCWFGAIDIDVYDLDLPAIARDVERLKLPLVVCRTKSGGAHLYLFTREALPAELVRTRLMEWSVALGYAGVEVFPKQVKLAGPQDHGNWINLPYFAGDRSTRYALTVKRSLSLVEFLDLADRIAITRDALLNYQLPVDDRVDDVLKDGPPCLQALARRGFPRGTRNNALFNLGVYVRKRFPDEWEPKLEIMNQRFMDPPLTAQEVVQVVKSIKKKDEYFYRCNEQPILGACNKQICLTRPFGIGQLGDDPGVVFGGLVKLETTPPTWIWDVNGHRVTLSTAQLMDQGRCHSKVIEATNIWPHPIKPSSWHKLVQGKLSSAEIVQVPIDATRFGQLIEYLRAYCTGHATARNRDELLLKKPFVDTDGRTYFHSGYFLEYLRQHRITGITERELFSFLHENNDVQHHFFNLKKKGFNCWSVKSFDEQEEDFNAPDVSPDDQSQQEQKL